MKREELLEKLRRKVRYYSILASAIPKDRLVQGKKLGIEECIKIIENEEYSTGNEIRQIPEADEPAGETSGRSDKERRQVQEGTDRETNGRT